MIRRGGLERQIAGVITGAETAWMRMRMRMGVAPSVLGRRRHLSVSAVEEKGAQVPVRFAPSPAGNLHVGADRFAAGCVDSSRAASVSAELRTKMERNGQHLRTLPSEKLVKLIGERWKSTGILMESEGPFIDEAVRLLKDGIALETDAEKVLSDLLSYPLPATLISHESKTMMDESLPKVASKLLAAYDSGELLTALEEGYSGWLKWVKNLGDSLQLQGKSLLMALHLLLTGKVHGPDTSGSMLLLHKAGTSGIVSPEAGFVTLNERFRILREVEWQTVNKVSSSFLSVPHNSPATIPNPSSLIHDFSKFCYQGDISRAMIALDAMNSFHVWADDLSYSHLIKCFLARRAISQAKYLHAHLFSKPFHYQPQTFLVNILLNFYVKSSMLVEAQALLDQMPYPNVVSWTTIISAYSKAKLHDKALNSLILMLRQGVAPNMFTYSSVLRACHGSSILSQLHCSIIKYGLDSDVFVRSALVDVYSKGGHLQNALLVFNEMPTQDLIVWNSIIAAFAQNNDGDEALNLFKAMKRAGFLANQPTLTSVLRACTVMSLLELGRQVHTHVLKYDQDLILNNALLDTYCKCGSLEDAKSVFTRMVEKDVISWSTMIAGLGQNGYSREALRLFESMKVSGIKPNYITVLGVLFACSHAGLVEDGLHYFRSMRELFGIDPGREHYGCMIDLLGRAGKLDEAVGLINEMDCQPDAVTWRCLLSACKAHRNVDLAIHAAKQVLNLDPEDGGTYVLLSNIYANTQRWEDVAEVRRIMNDKGIRKEPGCSWIEVNNQVHAFIIGDNSHPQINEINKKLNQLIHKLMGLGYIPDTNFVLRDLEEEQMEDSLRFHSEKLALVFGLMSLPMGQTIRVRKNLRICGDCHQFAKLLAKVENRTFVIRDPIRYHHFRDGACSCGDYW